MRNFVFWTALCALVALAHLAHAGVLWTEETLPLAAALTMKRGAILYRDIWFDKPPLVPAIYLLWGARIGAAGRLAGACWVIAAAVLAFFAASGRWTRREGYLAAGLTAFFLTFDTHSAVLPLAADLLLLVPHLAAMLLVWRRQYFLAGALAGIGFLFNTKGMFVLAACALFAWPNVLPLAAGFAAPQVAALLWFWRTDSLSPYLNQVWRWPAQYAGSPVVGDPFRNGFVRTANWLGFHAALVIGAAAFWRNRAESSRIPFALWTLLSLIGVALGWRFFPRYFFLLLPPVLFMAARGLVVVRQRRVWIALAAIALTVPLIRFAPRYLRLTNWTDLALDEDSREASALALRYAPRGASLYVWGYRPEDYVYTGFRPATRYLECQALTGVPADRHLMQSDVVLTKGTAEAREELARSSPDVLIDGLSLYNPALSMARYPELRPWLGNYREVGRTKGSVIYLRRISLAQR